MRLVRIIKNWDYPDLFRQTPKNRGIWRDIHFTLKPIKCCDYVIVLNYSPKKEEVYCPKENIWCIQQEPHNEYFSVRHKYASKVYEQVYTTDIRLKGGRYVYSHGCIPWHIDKSYDELTKSRPSEKMKNLSCISSNKMYFIGQKSRLEFIRELQKKLSFDLFGFGIKPIENKWDALAPYKYSLVLENFSSPYYWSEKIADCYLSWTMPIYYGCTNITDYFPKESFVKIDVKNTKSIDIIKKTINSNLYNKNFKAIAYARKLILEKYQFFPFLTGKIHEWENKRGKKSPKRTKIIIPNEDTFLTRMVLNIYRISRYLLR